MSSVAFVDISKWEHKLTKTFQELGMSAEINRALRENKFEAPFPIQEAAIPFLLKGVEL